MITLGLIGYPLTHSFSKKYFTDKFKQEKYKEIQFKNFEINSIDKIVQILETEPFLYGLAVTIPYKERVIPYLSYLDSSAQEIGAVNCIVNKKKQWIGYNTDIIGFTESLKPMIDFKKKNNALILGNGGAAKAVKLGLKRLNIDFDIVSRNPLASEFSYQELKSIDLNYYSLIINTSPVGMFPNINQYPDFPYQLLTNKHLVYDLIYNPEQTVFLSLAKKQGAIIKNGWEMLVRQAEENFKLWSNEFHT